MNNKSNLHKRFIEEQTSFPEDTASSYTSQSPSLITPFDLYHTEEPSKQQQPDQGFAIELQPQGKSATPSPVVHIPPPQKQAAAQPTPGPQLNTQPSLEQISHAISMPNNIAAAQQEHHPALEELEEKIVSGYWMYNLLLCCELVGGLIGLFIVLSVIMYVETINPIVAVFLFDSMARTGGCFYAIKARTRFDSKHQQIAIALFIMMVILDIVYSLCEVDAYKKLMKEDPMVYRPDYKRFVGGVILTGVILITTGAILLYYAMKILKLIKDREALDNVVRGTRGTRNVSVQY